MLYKMLRKVLFGFPPEDVHYFSMNALRTACKAGLVHDIIAKQFSYTSPALAKNMFGLQFINPVGLGAGFDKNALYLHELEVLGFGFAEIGTVTPKPQSGNEKPRLFRLSADGALINRMGFNNDGIKAVRERLEKRKETGKPSKMIIGGNIGKNKVTDNEEAWKDYVICFNELFGLVDYFTVNVSSPNTPGLRALQEKDALKKIFYELQQINAGKQKQVPMLRYYKVFNISQCRDIPEHLIPVKDTEQEVDPILECEHILNTMVDMPAFVFQGKQAYYDISRDEIVLPKMKSFRTSEGYYSTIFHELVHAIGHEKRLNRKTLTDMVPFGSPSYAQEELVAEMGAAFLCRYAGILPPVIENTVSYIDNWLGVFKNDKRFLITAAGQAQKAVDMILGRRDNEAKDEVDDSEGESVVS